MSPKRPQQHMNKQTTEHMPAIEDSEAILPRRLLSMIGGGWTVVWLLGAAGLIIVADLSLGWIFDFPLGCTALTLPTSGGFAALLAVLLAITLAGLQQVTPRSRHLSFAFLILTAFVLQFRIVFAYSDVEGMVETVSALRWLSELPVCTVGSPSATTPLPLWEFLQNRYAVDGSNLRSSFTTGLVVNLLLLALFAFITWIPASWCLLRRRFSSRTRRRADAVEAQEDLGAKRGKTDWNRTERALVVLLAAITTLFAMLGPMLLVSVTNYPQYFAEQVQNILWIGPLVYLADSARLAWAEPLTADAESSSQGTEGEQSPLVLELLVRNIRKTFPNRAGFDFVLKAQPRTSAQKADLVEPAMPVPGMIELHTCTLLATHLDRFVRVASQCILGNGYTLLVIAPIEAIADLRQEMERRLNDPFGLQRIACWSEGQPLEAGQDVEVIFATPESLALLLDRGDQFNTFFRMLGGMVFVAFHRLDQGLLHVAMTRMGTFDRDGGQLIALIQTEPRQGITDWITNLPLLFGLAHKAVDSQLIGTDIDQYVVLAHAGAADRAEMAPQDKWPTDAQLMVHAVTQAPAAAPYFLDLRARHVKSLRDTMARHLRTAGRHDSADRFDAVRHPRLLPEDHPHPMAVIDDAGNLVDALRTDITAATSREALRVILRGAYPAAAFLEDRIRAELGQPGAEPGELRVRLEELGRRFGSLTPEPEGGPVEFAMMLRQEVMARQKRGEPITQHDLAPILKSEDKVLRQLQISNTRAGIERLFRATLQIERRDGFVSDLLNEQRLLTYRLDNRVLEGAAAFETLRVKVRERTAQRGVTSLQLRGEALPLADHGLSYMAGTRFVINGRIAEVDQVDVQHREIEIDYREEETPGTYSFVRDYAFAPASDAMPGFAVEKYGTRHDRQQPQEFASGYMQVARRTRGFYSHPGGWPFAGKITPGDMTGGEVRSSRHLRSVAVLACNSLDGNIAPMRRRNDLPGAAQNQPSQSSGLPPEVAFTLATTLQDVLHTCFPLHAHRLAVLCPQAQPLQMRTDRSDPVLHFALNRHPGLRPLDPVTGQVGDLSADGNAPLRAVEDMAQAFLKLARQSDRAQPLDGRTVLTLLLVEDSDHDLGIARSVVTGNYEAILERWYAFVSHCAEAEKRPGFAYTFGTDKALSCYDFAAAQAFVKGMSTRVH